MKVLFVGTPDFAKKSLEAVISAGYEVVGVITAPDKPKGRGMKMAMSDVKKYALEKNIAVFQPEKIRKNPDFIEEIKALNADIACVVVYGKILPKEFLELFKYGCINVHPSLLPKYRGAAPIQWAIINGDKKTGVCTMYLDVGMDDGDIIRKEEVDIGEDETSGELWNRLSTLGAKMLVQTLKDIEKGNVTRIKQPEEFTLAQKLEKEMSKIDWENKTAFQIKNLVRGLNPGFGAYSILEGKKIKFWKINIINFDDFINKFSEFEEYKNRVSKIDNGTVIYSSDKDGLFIKAKDAIISVIEIQGENGKKMNINDYLRGNKIVAGQCFKNE